jgi:hypothetical protein
MSDEFIDETGKPVQPEVESIWLTVTSVKPLWLAVSIGLMFIGLFSFWPLMVGAAIAVVAITISWITESQEESDELPLV